MSDSNSTNQQTTHQTDNRRVIGQNGISAENSTVTIRNRTTTLDGQVANAAMSGMQKTAQAAIQSGNENLLASLGFGKSALSAALSAQADALSFAQSSSKQAAGVTTAAMDLTAQTFSGALSFADRQNVRTLDAVSSAQAEALKYADRQNVRTLDAMSGSQADAFAFARSSAAQSLGLTSDAMSQNGAIFDKAFSFADRQNNRTFDTLASTEKLVSDAYADAKGRGALTDKILIGAIAAMALVSFAAVQK